MLGPTHRAFATTAIAGTLLVTPQKESPVEIILALTVAWFSATLPDIDKKLPEGYHRTWTHAIWIPLLIGYGFYNSSGIVKILLLSFLKQELHGYIHFNNMYMNQMVDFT